jgi:hypothetical protein
MRSIPVALPCRSDRFGLTDISTEYFTYLTSNMPLGHS